MEEIEDKQREVQRRLGRCLLRLQQYEGLMKAVVAMHDLGGTPSTLASVPAQRSEELATTSLGLLAERLFNTVVVPEGFVENNTAASQAKAAEEVGIRVVVRIQMSQAEFERAKQDVKDLVKLRNTLVHHLLELFDLWTTQGCVDAIAYLSNAFGVVDEHLQQLRHWAESLDQAKQRVAQELDSPATINSLESGIASDGQVLWAASGIVACLREAAAALQVDDWTPLGGAIAWVGREYPAQTPELYGCRSWPHVLHQSKLFDLRYTREADAAKVAWYRERA